MALFPIRPWEPEETVGKLWHRLVGQAPSAPGFPAIAVTLDDMRQRMGILLRGLGGAHGIAIEDATPEKATSRRSFLERIGHARESETTAAIGVDAIQAPPVMALFDRRPDNESACLWLAAWTACAGPQDVDLQNLLRHDLLRLRFIWHTLQRTTSCAPGLGTWFQSAAPKLAATRHPIIKGEDEMAVEVVVQHLLGTETLDGKRAQEFWTLVQEAGPLPASPCSATYRPFKPIALCPEWTDRGTSAPRTVEGDSPAGGNGEADTARKRAKRHNTDQANRRDPLILHRFETIKTWAEMLNIGRKVEDSDEQQARKAAGDQEELGLSSISKNPASRLSFHLDLSPEEVERERLATGMLYPEWNFRKGSYLPDHVRVLETVTPVASDVVSAPVRSLPQQRRIARVRRQFEALMPRHIMKSGESEGSELDTEQAVRSLCDLRAGLAGDDRVFRRLTGKARDLSVAMLVDASRSTESVVDERQVIEVAREAIVAFSHGLQATGDRQAIYTFSSLRRDRVFINRLKDFNEAFDASREKATEDLKPGHYTRLGAAIRHVTARLNRQSSTLRLLLVVTDGKPNDADYYEGRFGIEDTRRAVMEARISGAAVFAVTIDTKAESYIPYIFGRQGFTIVSHPARLAEALPSIYRHLLH